MEPTHRIIVDTNLLLHFKRLDQLRVPGLSIGDVEFFLPLKVISELQGHCRSRDALRDRAKTLWTVLALCFVMLSTGRKLEQVCASD